MTTADTHTPPNFSGRLAAVCGVPAECIAAAEAFWDAQARAEGGEARWNPLNTTYSLPGSWLYNAQGVRNFAKPIDGLCATALTVTNGDYNGILGDLQSIVTLENGDRAAQFTALEVAQRNQQEIKLWGTDPTVVIEILQEEAS